MPDQNFYPDPDGNSTGMASGNVTPYVQNLSWDRQSALPTLAPLDLAVYNADLVYFTIIHENTAVDWLILTGYGDSGALPNVNAFHNLTLQDLADLSGSFYKARILFTFSKAGLADLQREVEVNLTLTGVSPTAIQTDQQNYDIVYRRDNNTLSGDTSITILNNTVPDTLSIETVGTLIKEGTFTTTYTLEEDPLFPFATNLELPTSGVVEVTAKLKKAGVVIGYFTITITVIESDEIIPAPGNMDFILRKDFSEVKSSVLQLTNPLNHAFTITGPAWLTFSATSGSASADITVTTVNSSTLPLGGYAGDIVVSYNGTTLVVPVTMIVIEFIDLPLQDHNFCMDGIILTAEKMNTDGFMMRITMDMTFVTAAGIETSTASYLMPFYQDKLSTDIGKKIQSYFPVVAEPLFDDLAPAFNNKLVYRPANVKLTLEELDRDYTILYSKAIDDLKFFAGRKPKLFPLFTDFAERRTFTGSAHIFSYYTGLETGSTFGTPANAQTVDDVQTVLFPDGDALDYDLIAQNLGLYFIPFPDPQRQTVVQWLNNNLVPEWMIFSGRYTLPFDYEHTADEFDENAQKYETAERQKITINTGWVLRSESGLIAEIIKSKVVFLKIQDILYRTYCTSTKLIREDSENFLQEYELEFKIVK